MIQTIPANLTFTAGQEQVACLRLTEKGLFRWYARCCNTPIGNTVGDYRFSFVGLVHTCLESPGRSLDDSFGPVRMWSFTKGAKQPVNPARLAMIAGMLRFAAMVIRARVNGDYRRTPFFSPDTGLPVVKPRILSAHERQALMS